MELAREKAQAGPPLPGNGRHVSCASDATAARRSRHAARRATAAGRVRTSRDGTAAT
jgi:hypothetical protein